MHRINQSINHPRRSRRPRVVVATIRVVATPRRRRPRRASSRRRRATVQKKKPDVSVAVIDRYALERDSTTRSRARAMNAHGYGFIRRSNRSIDRSSAGVRSRRRRDGRGEGARVDATRT